MSENGGLFGFAEQGYRPAIVLSIVLEIATIVTLGAYLVVSHARHVRDGDGRRQETTRRRRLPLFG